MAAIRFTQRLGAEYRELYDQAEIVPRRFSVVDQRVDALLGGEDRYREVARAVGAPWYFVAAIHNMESGSRFDRHLHNGDPLTARTRNVPAGRPAAGEPPFEWAASAVDALRLRRIDRVDEWSLERLLYELEGYNGWGYRRYHAHVKTPLPVVLLQSLRARQVHRGRHLVRHGGVAAVRRRGAP